MKKKFAFQAASFFVIFSSCQIGWYKNSSGEYRPKNGRFFSYKNPEFHLNDTLLIDTNAIYLAQLGKLYLLNERDSLTDSINNAVQYLRFYATGQVYFSRVFDTVPTLEKINGQDPGT